MSSLWAALVFDRLLKLKMVAAPKTFGGWFTLKFCLRRGSMDSLADKLLECLGARESAMVGSLCQNCEPTATTQHPRGLDPTIGSPLWPVFSKWQSCIGRCRKVAIIPRKIEPNRAMKGK
jgi:hypothetical protein